MGVLFFIDALFEAIDKIISLFHAHYQKITEQGVPTEHIRRINKKEIADSTNDTASIHNHSIAIYLIDKQGYTRKPG